MCSIHYEPNAYFIFDRAYDSFKELYRIHLTGFIFVVRAKTNLKYTMVKWNRRIPKYVLTDAEVKLTGCLSEKKYPESSHFIRYYDKEGNREFTSLTNATHIWHWTLPISIRKDGWANCSLNGKSSTLK
nr:hypothetical protein [uncultured Bacteroides sp.]